MTGTPVSTSEGVPEPGDTSSTRPLTATRVLEFLKLLAGASTAMGAVMYAIVRVALTHFYAAFGTTPEEVGWDTMTVLARFAFSFTLLVLLAVFFVVRAQEDKWIRTGSFLGLFTTGWGRIVSPLAVIVIGAVLVFFAQSRVNDLRSGRALTAAIDSVVPISAPCTHAAWIEAPSAVGTSLPEFGPDRRLFLLGGSDAVTVLYDASTNTTFRVPSGSIVLRSC
jgi:hypothetical protein